MLSNVPDYQALFDLEFSIYLQQQGASEKTKKNYRMDVRHFFAWLSKEHTAPAATLCPYPSRDILNPITADVINWYKQSLSKANIPLSSVNRTLSSLRLFFQCATKKGWIEQSPMETIRNLLMKEAHKSSIKERFTAFLTEKQTSGKTQKNYQMDVAQFLAWLRTEDTVPASPDASSPRVEAGLGGPPKVEDQDLCQWVTKDTIENYIRSLTGTRTPIATINRRLSSLRLFFQFAVHEGWIDQNPMVSIRNINNKELPSGKATLSHQLPTIFGLLEQAKLLRAPVPPVVVPPVPVSPPDIIVISPASPSLGGPTPIITPIPIPAGDTFASMFSKSKLWLALALLLLLIGTTDIIAHFIPIGPPKAKEEKPGVQILEPHPTPK
ncbi:site-specific integrase, partial [Patescibacteria group bacterium]|nr:site-specific integrase [Patescibacteria group bacterium]